MGSKSIPVEEINFHPTSFCDRNARVFWWREELYRGISPQKVGFYRGLFAKGTAQRAIEQKLLVATELTEWTLPDYPLILKHHPIPYVSYAHEWCPAMLRDCAWLVTKLMLELAKDDLTLADVSTFDMMFDGCQPVFVDFGSIELADIQGDRVWTRYQSDFRDYFITPLTIMAQGRGNLARWLFMDYDHEVMVDCGTLMAVKLSPQWSNKIASKTKRLFSRKLEGADLVKQLWREVEQIPLINATPALDKTSAPEDNVKQNTVRQILSDLQPQTVLDLGCDRGHYSQLAASLGSVVVAVDRDEAKVTHCYQNAVRNDLSIFPVVMNIRDPSPGHGVCNQIVTPALKRFRCELVLALGLVHQLVFEQYLNLEQTVATVAAFAQRWLLVEFYSPQTKEVKPFWSDWHSWYSLENFQQILAKYFDRVEVVSGERQKVLLLCEK